MSRGSGALFLEPRPSRWLAGLLLFLHGGAAACALATPLPVWARMVLAGLFLFNLSRVFPRYVLLRRGAVTALLWDERGEWRLRIEGAGEVAARLEPGGFVSPLGMVLGFRTCEGNEYHAVILLLDSLDAETLRRLRVRLRTEGAAGSG